MAQAASPSWTYVAAPLPAGAAGSELSSVSCPTPQTCVAVGDSHGGSSAACSCRGFSEVLRDGQWAVRPLDTGDPMRVEAVSCSSSAFCMAVGTTLADAPRIHAVAQFWNGRWWSSMPAPVSAVALSSVSCLSRSWCVAVGLRAPSSSSYQRQCCAVVATWNGRQWSTLPLTAPASSYVMNSYLTSVSCANERYCATVGTDADGRGAAWFYDGQTWTFRGTSDPDFTEPLQAVSCPNPAGCEVVGSLGITGVAFVTPHRFLERRVTGMAKYTGGLTDAVSCTTPSRCTAVGTSGLLPAKEFFVDWNGQTWRIEQPHGAYPGKLDTYLASVSCSTGTRCVAVGMLMASNYTHQRLLIETRG